jgi:hypothetical protein
MSELNYEEKGTMIILILEDDNNRNRHLFNSTDGLEEYLETIDLTAYVYKNILFQIDGELNFEMSQFFKKRYL